MNATCSTDILDATLVPFIERHYPTSHHFQQDNDPKYTSRWAQNYFEEKRINRCKTLASSPDLNPIENVCSYFYTLFRECSSVFVQSSCFGVRFCHAMLDCHFDLLLEILEKMILLINHVKFNMDETGMPLDPEHAKVITRKGNCNPIAPSSGDKSKITVVACVNAAGSFMPPMVILNCKTLPPRFTEGEVPGIRYGLSAKGWIDQALLDGWFTDHFLKYAPIVHPSLLLLEGHSSHFYPDTTTLAVKEKVIILHFLPIQPTSPNHWIRDVFAP